MINGHGDDLFHYKHLIKSNFSSNVYNRIGHEELFERLSNKLYLLSNYPEPEPLSLETAFANFYHVEADCVCVTNGATEGIYLIAQTFKGKKSAVWMPTFSEYADACRLHGHRVSAFYTYDSVPADADLVWLCNPNNPTGEVRDYQRMKEWIGAHPDKLFVIDQSYESFTFKRLFSVSEVAALPNVILIHSLTKHFAIPGLRMGYLTGNAKLMKEIRLQRMPWSVNSLAIEAGFFALEKNLELSINLGEYLDIKEKFVKELKRTGIVDVWDSDTHFFLVKLRMGKASALKEYLAEEHGILIRNASNFEGLDESFFRLATQTEEENQALVKALSDWMACI